MRDSMVFVGADEPIELGDVILMELGEAVYWARKTFGTNQVVVESPKGEFEIETPEEEPWKNFDDRLEELINSSRMVANRTGISYCNIVGLLLVLDGWSWNVNVFRAPIWMDDHREIPIEEIKKLKGLEWVTGSSLEIRSRLKEGRAKFEK